MHSSPAPKGQADYSYPILKYRYSGSVYRWVRKREIHRPDTHNRSRPRSLPWGHKVDQTAVIPRRNQGKNRADWCSVNASPLVKTVLSDWVSSASPSPASIALRKASSIDGTKCKWVILSRAMLASSAEGSFLRRAPTETVAPLSAHQKSSHTDTSKEMGVFCKITSRPQRILILHPFYSVKDRAMLNHYPFRVTCRTGGIDHIG